MISFREFYNIAEYGNERWKGCFSPREIASNAYDYKCEYNRSLEQGKPTYTMIALYNLICDDMNIPKIENPTIEQVEDLLQTLLEEL